MRQGPPTAGGDSSERAASIVGDWLTSEPLTVPMLPQLAHHLIDLAADPDVTVARLSALVSKDQVLASRVLGIANSAYSAPMQTITTVAGAVVRLGTAAVRNVVITVCFTSRMHDPRIYGEHGSRLVDHAIGTAYLARLVAERVRVSADEMFLCGLMHDLGKLVILKQAHDHAARTGRAIPEDQIQRAFDEHHAAFGGMALKRWRLPEAIQEPVTYHHDYMSAPSRRIEAATIYLADRLSYRYGFGYAADGSDITADPAFALLELDAHWLEALDGHAPGLVSVAREILS